MLLLSWLPLVAVATAQFNSTIEITLDNLSPSFGTDYREGPFFTQWVYDNTTRFFQNNPIGRSSGSLDLCFVAKSFRVYGDVVLRSNKAQSGSLGAAHLWGSVKDDKSFTGPSEGIIADWNASQALVMQLAIVYPPSALITVHNVTIDVPVRTQAYVCLRLS